MNNITGLFSLTQPGDSEPSTVKNFKENEDKKEEFHWASTKKESQQAEASKAVTPWDKSVIAIKKLKLCSVPFTMKNVRELGEKTFVTCIVLIKAAAVGHYIYCSYIEQQEELHQHSVRHWWEQSCVSVH